MRRVKVPRDPARRLVRFVRSAGRQLFIVTALLAATSFLIAPVESLWSKNLTIDGKVTMGGCQDFLVTGAVVSVDQTTGRTSYGYTLTGGGPGCNHNLSFVAVLPVCFNPKLLVEGGEVALTAQPAGWTYNPKDKPGDMQVKWNADSTVGPGPLNATFSFTLNGTDIPMVAAGSMVHAGGGVPDPVEDFAGLVMVPWPSSCGPAPTSADPGQAATPVPEPGHPDSEPPGRSRSSPTRRSPGGPGPTATPEPSVAPEPSVVPEPSVAPMPTITPVPSPGTSNEGGQQ